MVRWTTGSYGNTKGWEGSGWKSFAAKLRQALSLHTTSTGMALYKGKHESQALSLLKNVSSMTLNKGKWAKSYAEAAIGGVATNMGQKG